MMPMSSFSEVLDQLRENQPQGKYGIAFEKGDDDAKAH